jgi:hypothetical protein
MRSAVLAIVAAAALSGCASTAPQTSHEKVAGWPVLRVFEHYVPHVEMQTRCARYVVRYGARPLACAEFNFSEGRCDIWYSRELGAQPDLVQHERLHCAGYDHPGEYEMVRMLENWKRRRHQAFSARLTVD